MSVDAITQAYGAVAGTSSLSDTEAAKMEFMELLVAQIQNQDPLSPMDNAEFTSQITQFTMLDELATMTRKLDESVLMAQSINNTAMLALVGRSCTVAGDEVHVQAGVASGNKLNAPEAGTATITVRDGDGKVSRREFDGPPEHFSDFDRNGDGFISEDEAPTGPPPGAGRGRSPRASAGRSRRRSGGTARRSG